MFLLNKKLFAISTLCLGMIALTTSSFKKDEHKLAKENLRVIPRNVSDEELIAIMKDINKALGVNCNYCHVHAPATAIAEGKPAHDFASDDKIQKQIARKMMRMTKDINEKMVDIGNGEFERVSCNTCHRGSTQPSMVNIDPGAPAKK